MTKILYVDCYSVQDVKAESAPSSMSIGYGVTCSDALCEGLEQLGHVVVRPLLKMQPRGASRASWLAVAYHVIEQSIRSEQPDLIFFFHSFGVFPAEIRRLLLETRMSIPLVGYSHGSHWDPSDHERISRHPGMEILDLANLLALDRVLFASERAKTVVIEGVGDRIAPEIARELAHKSRVVGLPIYDQLIDRCFERKRDRTTIVFNHAPVSVKCPAVFMGVADVIMTANEHVDVLLTRRFEAHSPGRPELDQLVARFGKRVMLGDDMSITDYYRALWSSHIQVSTATHESFGVATLEAMYTKNCCVLPNRESYPEVTGGIPGILYDSVEEMTSLLSKIVTNPDLVALHAEALASRARKYVAAAVSARVGSVIDELA